MNRLVYIAALGHCSALGSDTGTALAALRAGTRPSTRHRLLDRDWPCYRLPFDDPDWLTRARRAVRHVGQALMPALPTADACRSALFVASSSLQIGAIEEDARKLGTISLPTDAAAFSAQLTQWLGIGGTPWTFSTTCTSALAALDAAATQIRHGHLEHAVVLGIELANDTTLAGFAGLGLLADTPEGAGLVLGEAVAGVVLSAQPGTGWQLAACRLGVDSHSPTGPSPDGRIIAQVIHAALDDARLTAAEIDLLKPHGGGLSATADAEANALDAVFGTQDPPQREYKSGIGHTLGASGLAELTLLLADLAQAGAQPRHILLDLIGFGGSIGALVLSADTAAHSSLHTRELDVQPDACPASHATQLELDSKTLSARARALHGAPLRRAGALTEACLVGVADILQDRPPTRSTAVLFASRSGPRHAFTTVLADLCLRGEDPMPFDFLATQAVLAALPMQKMWPDIDYVCHLPITGDESIHLQRMMQLATAWLREGRHDRVLCGIVEPGDDRHRAQWHCFEH